MKDMEVYNVLSYDKNESKNNFYKKSMNDSDVMDRNSNDQ